MGVRHRTTFDNGTTNFTLGYTSQNREFSITATPTPAPTPLAYDFKGNVATRYPLAGGSAYTYTCDSYDRLASAVRSGKSGAGKIEDSWTAYDVTSTTLVGTVIAAAMSSRSSPMK